MNEDPLIENLSIVEVLNLAMVHFYLSITKINFIFVPASDA